MGEPPRAQWYPMYAGLVRSGLRASVVSPSAHAKCLRLVPMEDAEIQRPPAGVATSQRALARYHRR